ncbi:MAG: type II toxin-antitoxin system VapC family toxin [Candidatus Aquicultor sp.]
MYLVDSSVILKWFLSDEEAADKAARLYRSMVAGETELGTDSSAIHEVANVLYAKAGFDALRVMEAVAQIFNDGLVLISSDEKSLVDAIKIGLIKKIGTHDAVLITASIKSKSMLMTADHYLFKVAQEFTDARLLQDMG